MALTCFRSRLRTVLAFLHANPEDIAQSVWRVAPLSRNVRQPDYIPANAVAGHKAEPRPRADEKRLARPEHDRMDV